MGNRLSKIYTRTGDDGTTGLGDGERIPKDSARVEAFGTVDELNSLIGLVATHNLPVDLAEHLATIQHRLFDLGGELCIPNSIALNDAATEELEHWLDGMNESLPPLKEFVLPGGSPAAATCHLARAVCRRAERRVISLAASETVNAQSIRYLNRLSDLLFVMARFLNKHDDHAEVLWQSNRSGQK
jgi:cob(I)alamin adenosyltransferase